MAHDRSTCWEWPGHRTAGGYGVLRTYGRSGRDLYAHRLIWEQYAGPIPEGIQVLHRCDNPPCVRPIHLFLGTVEDNVRDMWTKGRGKGGFVRGETVGNHKLTEAQVIEIRALYGPQMGYKRLAQRFGVSRSTIMRIVKERSWTHVTAAA